MIERLVGHVPLQAKDTVQYLQVARANEALEPLPTPTGAAPYRLELASVIHVDPTDTLTFTVIGDSGGIVDAAPQQAVAAALAKTPGAFVYHVGDLVYFNGEDGQWYPQMYEPYDHVAVPFMGIPGNHDGWALPGSSSLAAFVTNMCAPAPVLTKDAGDANRDAMTQPNVYWTLRANLVTVIGLYTNVPSGGVIEPDQGAWLAGEIENAPEDRPIIVALHHPPYSADAHHGGSAAMGTVIDAAAKAAARWPDLVLSGHVHNYQRFSRVTTGKTIPYLVVGASGYHNLHGMSPGIGSLPWIATPDTKLDAAVDSLYGFLTLTVSGGKISGSYTTVAKDGTTVAGADTF
jgi:hypothetical protein